MIKDGEMGLLETLPLNCGSRKMLGVTLLSGLSPCLPPVSVFYVFLVVVFSSPLPGPQMPEAHNACRSPKEYGISSAPKRKDNKTTSKAVGGRLTYNTAERKELHSSNAESEALKKRTSTLHTV